MKREEIALQLLRAMISNPAETERLKQEANAYVEPADSTEEAIFLQNEAVRQFAVRQSIEWANEFMTQLKIRSEPK